MVDAQYSFHAVCCGDRHHLPERQPSVQDLVSEDRMEAFSRFPGASDDFPLMFYLMNHNHEVCSYFRTIPDVVTVNEETRTWAWTGDNFTHPEFRRRGLSTLLQRQGTQYLHERCIGRGSVYSTDVTIHTFKKLGFSLPGYARRFLMLRSLRPFIEGNIQNPAMRRLCTLLSKPLTGLAMLTASCWNRLLSGGTDCTETSSVSEPALGQLLQSICAQRPVHFSTDIQLLNSKIEMAKRTGQVSLWLVHCARSGNCLAYMIVRERLQEEPLAEKYRGFRLMTLMDFGFDANNRSAATAVVGHLVRLFLNSRSDVLEIVSSNELLNRTAATRGFVPIGRGMSFGYSVPEAWQWPDSLNDVGSWPLTSFCGDGYTF